MEVTQPTAHRTILTRAPKISKNWLCAWCAIFMLILVLGLLTPQSPLLIIIKVGGVLLCSVYSALMFPKGYFLQAAMFTTFLADCILAYNNLSTFGLFIFYLAQSIHLYRLQPQERHQNIILFVITVIFVIIVNNFTAILPPIFLICGFYGTTLVCNIYMSWRWYRAEPHTFTATCALVGFTLFACCDLCTVVSFMSLTGVFLPWLYAPANFLAWFFYYPSQILVSNSAKYDTMKLKEGKC